MLRKTVLAVDGGAVDCRCLREALGEDYGLETAKSAKDAALLLALRRDKIAAVLMDADLPGAQDLARQSGDAARVPAILCARQADPEAEEAALKRGAAAFVAPFDARAVRRLLDGFAAKSPARGNRSVRDAMPVILSAIMASSTDLSFVKDRDFRYLCCSRPFAKMVGLRREEDVAGKTDYDLFDQSTAEKYRSDDVKLFEGGQSLVDYLEAIPSNDGVQHYSSTSKHILRDAAGEIIGLYGIGRDVTDTRIAFDRLKLLTDNIPGGIATYAYARPSMRLTYFNDGFCRMLGYTREEYTKICESGVTNITFAEDVPRIMAQVDELDARGKPVNCTYRVHTKGGGCKWVNLRCSAGERREGVLTVNAVLFDVTEIKAAEEALRVHEEEIKLALSKMSRIISEYDIGTRTLTLPDTYATKYHFPQVARDVPDSMREIGGMDDEAFAAYCAFYRAIIRGEEPAPIEIQKRTPDGTARWERMTAYTIRSEDGKPVKALVAADNTTEQHRQYELERSRPMLGEENLMVHALFNLNTGATLDYAYQDGRTVPPEERTAFLFGGDNLDAIIVGDAERERYRALNDPQRLLERYRRGETELSIDYRRRVPGGDTLWVRNLLRMVAEPGGSDVLLFEYCYNIEYEKVQELMNRALIRDNYDYVAYVNAVNRHFTVFMNEDVHYGIPPQRGDDLDEVMREAAYSYIHEDDRAAAIENLKVENIRKNLENADRFQFVFRLIRPDGDCRYKKVTEHYIDRETRSVIITREDVTQIMREEAEKNKALSAALGAANQASQAKTTFLSRMSHELRTPMNAIIGLSALSASELDDPKALENNISKIGMSARYLLSLINDILEMSRIESGRMTLNESPFDFEQLISDVNNIIYEQASAKGLDYDVIVQSYTEPTYVGDATKVQEILVNVLGNAVKFTPAGGKVTLTIEQLHRVRNRACVRFTVTDTGVGIDEEFLPHLFDAFAQESATFVSTSTGTGLGLAITKNLVEMMNGQVQVRSIKGMGSVFTVDVQLGISNESRKYLDMAASMHLESISALVVDDDVTVCKSTENILRAMGMRAEWADSGLRAVARVAAVHEEDRDFDAIFIDWRMPDIDGIETTRRIRKIVGPDVTIIIITAYDWRGIEEEARAAGVDLFMEKPLFQSSIVKAFEKVFMTNREKIAPEQPAIPDFTGRHILLAEDHPLNVEVAKRLLERIGAQVTVANNGLEALETFTTAQDDFFDAILMDIRMPEMDGLTATKAIRKLRKASSRDIPIIAMTANAFDEDVELSLRCGMNAHLAKPIEPKVLYATLDRLMK